MISAASTPVGFWRHPVQIQVNNFTYKSLSEWACNIAVGCGHGCGFCYVPGASTNKLAPALKKYGVSDADAEWGEYVLLRPWDEKKFKTSLRWAESIPAEKLKRDGNRAVMFCSTTDPYQVFRGPSAKDAAKLTEDGLALMEKCLTAIRDHSTLNVRILTRGPLAKQHFDLMRSFGKRLVFGMSLPTLRNDLSSVYEPHAPAPARRLETLHAARDAGLNVFVAVAPTYPECDIADLRATFRAVAALRPVTIFNEPINVRAENVTRIAALAERKGVKLNTGVLATKHTWRSYALDALRMAEEVATECGVADRLHLWPDKALGTEWSLSAAGNDRADLEAWLHRAWHRVSEWPL